MGLGSCCSFKRRWLRFDVIEDLLDYVWVSDVSNDAHGAATQGAGGNIDIEDSSESFSPSQEKNMGLRHYQIGKRILLNKHNLSRLIYRLEKSS